MSLSPEDGPSPRLCHLIKWPDFDGYGFNLHAEKAKTGQYIGKVDDHSPAQLAGLKEGDRIIEVNLVNISNENHRQVVERIKSIPNETKLLVVDDNTDRWYKERKLIVKSSQANVIHYKTPVPQPQLNEANQNGITASIDNNNEDNVPNKAQPSANGFEHHVEINHKTSANDHENVNNSVSPENGAISSGSSSPQSIPRKEAESNSSVHNNRPSSGASNTNNSVPDSPTSSKSGSTSSVGVSRSLSESGDLNLNMSASEMRQLLAQRKKHDAKKAQIDLRQKYEIIQQM